MKEGKLLGHIVSPEGVRIHPSRVEAIQTLSLPRSKKEVQAFLGKINFLRRYISNFAELVKDITSMLKKGNEVKWNVEPRESFIQIKRALTEAPMIIIPVYSKDFLIFSFASFDIVAVILLQRNEEGQEKPIAFFSKGLRDVEVKYEIMEKQAYALVKALKAFRVYVLHSKVTAYVPSTSVKDILIQPNIDGKKSKWIAKILEFDLKIRPTRLIKGQGLAKLLAEANRKDLGMDFTNEQSRNQQNQLFDVGPQTKPLLAQFPWYKDVIYFLQELRPPDGLQRNKERDLKLKRVR
jgi:hypothetical protein